MQEIPLWRQVQRTNFTDWKELLCFLHLEAQDPIHPNPRFVLNLPRRLAEKMEKGKWDDPLLRQFLPTLEEKKTHPLFVYDPVGDSGSVKKPKLLHKYQGRALLLCSSACAMHCRYCFRQNFPYETQVKSFAEELAVIAADPTLTEIILSGGDPLSLGNAQLGDLIAQLSLIPHLKRIRFHTRFPIGIPERIDEGFLRILQECPKQIVFILHCNHAREFDEEIFSRLKQIQMLGIPVLTQSVLLKGVNDDAATLKELFELLANRGILPYYLHQLDRVQGTMHFEVEEERGLALMDEIARELSGYAVPKYVREVPNQPYKVSVLKQK